MGADNPLHTCFSWVGTGAFTSRHHVDRFLSLSTLLAYPRDELAHADNSFTTFQNEPPYVLTTGELDPLPTPLGGHSDGEGIRRNKDYIVSLLSLYRTVVRMLSTGEIDELSSVCARLASQQKGLVRLSAYLGARFPLALAEVSDPAHELTPLLTVSSSPYRSSLSPPLPPHPWSHHARSICLETDSCLFLTNIQLLPPPDASQYPGPEKVKGLEEWEEAMGWVARGWTEGDERWREEERWATEWGYANAVDGDPTTAFRSPDCEFFSLSLPCFWLCSKVWLTRARGVVIHTGDYLGLLLIAPLDPGVTRSATLHVILEDAQRVLLLHEGGDNSQGGGGGKRRIWVEVSADGYKWVSRTHTRTHSLSLSRALWTRAKRSDFGGRL